MCNYPVANLIATMRLRNFFLKKIPQRFLTEVNWPKMGGDERSGKRIKPVINTGSFKALMIDKKAALLPP